MESYILSADMFYIDGSILKLDEINKLSDKYYILYNVIYNNKKIGDIGYNFEFDDINFSPINIYYNQEEYDIINNILKKNNYFDKKIFQLPSFEIINYNYFEYKYVDNFKKEEYFISININNINNIEFIINSELVAVISDNILTFLNNYETKDIKMFYYYLIDLVIYNFNNDPLIQCENNIITFNTFEDKVKKYL
jgi:hypothetical protein